MANKKILQTFITGFFLLIGASVAHATVIQITGTSAASGELGWFVLDDDIFATDTSLVASQFIDFSFSDPLSAVDVNTGNLLGDTGVTYFGFIGGDWTVTGGGGDSLTTTGGDAVWIAGTSYLWFRGGNAYADVSWSTSDYVAVSPVPLPGSITMLGLGLAGLGALKRRKRAA